MNLAGRVAGTEQKQKRWWGHPNPSAAPHRLVWSEGLEMEPPPSPLWLTPSVHIYLSRWMRAFWSSPEIGRLSVLMPRSGFKAYKASTVLLTTWWSLSSVHPPRSHVHSHGSPLWQMGGWEWDSRSWGGGGGIWRIGGQELPAILSGNS